jgi:carboxyl-terminal processing protease
VRRALWALSWSLIAALVALFAMQRPAMAHDTLVAAPPARFDADFARTFEGLVALVRREYWDAQHLDWEDWAQRHRDEAVSAPDRAAFDAVMRRMLAALGDDHSVWTGVPAAPATDAASGGAALPPRLGVQFALARGRGLVVERVYPSTPAEAAGLRRGDVVVALDSLALAELESLAEANAILVGALLDGPVTLAIERRRVRLEIEVAGAAVPFGEVSGAPYARMLDSLTGYLKVPSFNDAGVGELAHRALAELQAQGAVALVLDLRDNYGGRLVEAGALLGAFMEGAWAHAYTRGRAAAEGALGDGEHASDDLAWRALVTREHEGVVSQLVTTSGEVLGRAQAAGASWRGPVVVLVSARTVSAGELVALALQDQGRATVVGEATAGTVEAVHAFRLADGSRVLLAVADLRSVHGLVYADGVSPAVIARADTGELARGVDAPLVEARRLLGGLPFTPDRRF